MRPTVPYEKPRGPRFLYCNFFGRLFLPLFSARWLSRLAGKYLDSPLSKPKIKRFVKKHGVDLGEFLPETYRSFNDFFTRRIRPELRPFDSAPEAFCAPCDGAATLFPVTKEGKFNVKGFDYTLETLLGDGALAEKYVGGTCLVIRLTVGDYHRFHFPDGGTAGARYFIKGKLHTVQPAALEKRRVFAENCREIAVLHTEHFGDVCQVEVGAMFVGRIVNADKPAFRRGEEKGKFEFGGSTVIVLAEAGRVAFDPEFAENTAAGKETKVRCGERIGVGA